MKKSQSLLKSGQFLLLALLPINDSGSESQSLLKSGQFLPTDGNRYGVCYYLPVAIPSQIRSISTEATRFALRFRFT